MNYRLAILYILTFGIALTALPAPAQQKGEVWSRAKIKFTPQKGMKQLSALGVEADHGQVNPGYWFVSDFSSSELKKIRSAGFTTEVLIADVQQDFLRRNSEKPVDKAAQADYFDPACNGTGQYKIPQHWDYGSMGGHLTYEEMLHHLDSMRILYPNLISARTAIDTFKTENDSSIWYVRITDEPQLIEDEPKALFTAVHHAREPVGMHQLIFFMWYLLENYEGNDEVKNMLNNSDLYFIPCLNPDGYKYNQEQFPQGGGMWRKNLAKNPDNTFGVDLNRNYGFRWGVDDFGSSPDPSSDVYRGTEAFSEPETKAVKKLSEIHAFKVALNYHTYGNLLLNPYGYSSDAPFPDSSLFRDLGLELTKENDFRTGNSLQALGYSSNGTSDDYLYASYPDKPSVIAYTPEVGNEFWPTQNEILPLCLKTMHQNLAAVRALHPMITFKDLTGVFHRPGFDSSAGPPRLLYQLKRVGPNFNPGSVFTLTFDPMGADGLSSITRSYTDLAPGQTITDSIALNTDALAIKNPDQISWQVQIENQLFRTTDTIYHYGGHPISNDNWHEKCENAGNWIGDWVISAENPQQGLACLKTNEGEYASNQRAYVQRQRFFDLRSTDIHSAEMSFYTRYRVQKNYDMVSLQFSTDSGANWIPVCTEATKPSSSFTNQAGTNPPDNLAGEDTITPVWDGIQSQWQREYLDLQDYLGNKLWMRFYFRSDGESVDSGFAVDNLRIRAAYILTSVPGLSSKKNLSFRIVPNPGSGDAEFVLFGFQPGQQSILVVRDAAGKVLIRRSLSNGSNRISYQGLASGCYFAEVQRADGTVLRNRWMIR